MGGPSLTLMAELVKEVFHNFGERRRPVEFTLEGENDAKNEIALLLCLQLPLIVVPCIFFIVSEGIFKRIILYRF